MSAIRLPLLCAFAGGCLSSALLLGLWRADSGSSAPVAKHQRSPQVELAAPVAAALVAPIAEPQGVLASATAEHAPGAAVEPVPQAAQVVDNAAPEPAGSAVSDVLTDLEAAYRAHVAATAPARAASPPNVVASAASAALGSAPAAAAEPVAVALPLITPPPPAAAPLPAPPAAPPPALAPVAVAPPFAPPVAPPPIADAPAYVAQDDSRPTQVHIGDVNQNTYITNVRQGDVYLIQMQQQMQQMQQMRQLAMLQYMQLLGMSSGLAAPAQRGRGRGAERQATPFTSTITNPDNPWGFHFSPPNLVH